MNVTEPSANGTFLATTTPEPTTSIGVFSNDSSFTAAQRMAKALAASTLMPAAFQNNIPNVLIAMELSHRIGASVMMVAQNLDVIHGRPGWRATFLIATVNNSKRFTPLRFRFQGEEGKLNWGCRAVAKDRETGEECVGTLITMKMAADEGWSKKSGSKWLTMPEQMLCYRAASFWTRLFAPELSLGMHTADELQDAYGIGGVTPSTALPADLVPASAQSLETVLGVRVDTETGEVVEAKQGSDPPPPMSNEELEEDERQQTLLAAKGRK